MIRVNECRFVFRAWHTRDASKVRIDDIATRRIAFAARRPSPPCPSPARGRGVPKAG
jgi:hypothetical protein